MKTKECIHEARKALTCLYLEVPSVICKDVTMKVEKAIAALLEEIKFLKDENARTNTKIKSGG